MRPSASRPSTYACRRARKSYCGRTDESRRAGSTPDGALDVRADLTIAADGRESILREARLDVVELGAPMDILWLRLSKRPEDPHETFGYVRDGRIMALIDRGVYWQCAYVIPKGTLAELHQRGLGEFHAAIAAIVPFLADRVDELASWDDVKLLTVRVKSPAAVVFSGAALHRGCGHAMSPIGGVGINLAIQDAVASANMLAPKLLRGGVDERDLAAVQRRREPAARLTQALQLFIQRRIIGRVLTNGRAPFLHRLPALLRWLPFLPRIPGRLVGLGFRPEHVLNLPVRE